jgi:hypothetical protein
VRGRCSIFSQLPDQSKEAQVGSFEAVRVLKYESYELIKLNKTVDLASLPWVKLSFHQKAAGIDITNPYHSERSSARADAQ